MANENQEWYTAYAGCLALISLPKSGAIRPMVIKEVNTPDYKNIMCSYFSKSGKERSVIWDIETLKKAEWLIPECKMLNCAEAAAYYSFNSERQFRKGLKDFRPTYITGGLVYTVPFLYAAEIGYAWKKPYPVFDVALDDVYSGSRYSTAFARYWAVSCFYGEDEPVLFHRTDPVGKIKDGKIVLPEAYRMFESYLENITRRKLIYE